MASIAIALQVPVERSLAIHFCKVEADCPEQRNQRFVVRFQCNTITNDVVGNFFAGPNKCQGLACGTYPLALVWLPQSANFRYIYELLCLLEKKKTTRNLLETTFKDINCDLRAF